MASAMIGGLLTQGWDASAIRVVEIAARRARAARARVRGEDVARRWTPRRRQARLHRARGQAAADARGRARACALRLAAQLVITIAAGIRLADLARWLGGYARLVRAMPNTPALVARRRSGALCAAPAVSAERERARPKRSSARSGTTLWVEREEQLDAVTAVSGSGPAYVFYFIEALEQAARGARVRRAETARRLALETFSGAAQPRARQRRARATLRERVTSKGGTTERALEVHGRRTACKEAIVARRAAPPRSARASWATSSAGTEAERCIALRRADLSRQHRVRSLHGRAAAALLHAVGARARAQPAVGFLNALTDFMVRPARRVIPGLWGLDLATLVLAWLAPVDRARSSCCRSRATSSGRRRGSRSPRSSLMAAVVLVKLLLYIVMVVGDRAGGAYLGQSVQPGDAAPEQPDAAFPARVPALHSADRQRGSVAALRGHRLPAAADPAGRFPGSSPHEAYLSGLVPLRPSAKARPVSRFTCSRMRARAPLQDCTAMRSKCASPRPRRTTRPTRPDPVSRGTRATSG